MLDDKTSKQLEYKVWERLNLDQLDNPKMDLLQKKGFANCSPRSYHYIARV